MLKWYKQSSKKALTYFKNHPEYNALVHALGGVAVGILITGPLIYPHPIRWALLIGGLSILGHLYTLTQKK
jgi:hypothetical protein